MTASPTPDDPDPVVSARPRPRASAPDEGSHELATARAFERLRASDDPRLRQQLILDHRWIADRSARRFRHRGETPEDLGQVALLGLVKAVDRFDPARGTAFPAFAFPTVIGEIKRHFRDATWSVGVPRRAKDLLSGLADATRRLEQELGRSPTAREVATELGVSTEIVAEALEARTANALRPLQDAVDVRHRSLLAARLDDEPHASAEVACALDHLDPTRRAVVAWRFFDGLTQSEIAARLDTGQVQVSRLLKSILTELRPHLATDVDDCAGRWMRDGRREHDARAFGDEASGEDDAARR